MSRVLNFIYEGVEICRLDKLLVNALAAEPEFSELSRSQIKHRIMDGHVVVNGEVAVKAGALVKGGYAIKVDLPDTETAELAPYDFPLNIMYEDESLVVVDKPAGISMHPGAGNYAQTLLNALSGRFVTTAESFDDKTRLGIVHRLDKDTSGVVVVARTVAALAALSAQFAERRVVKGYLALVFVTPRAKREVQVNDCGRIESFMGRHPTKRTLMAVVNTGGRLAVTGWRRLELLPHACLLEVKPETGRTHQIRVHMDSIGSPILGDPVYGIFGGLPKKLSAECHKFGRQALHAFSLEFNHPQSGARLRFTSEIPVDMQRLLEAFRQEDAA